MDLVVVWIYLKIYLVPFGKDLTMAPKVNISWNKVFKNLAPIIVNNNTRPVRVPATSF